MEVGMRYKMILGQTLFSFFKKEKKGLRIKEVRFMNRDLNDEESETVQRYVSGSAPIASLSDEMVCFLGEVSRCFGRLSGDESWEKDVWLCVDADVRPENNQPESSQPESIRTAEEETVYESNMLPMENMGDTGGELGLQ
jgi:hypothetical protein